MDYKRLRNEINIFKKREQLSISEYNRLKKLVIILGKDKSEKGINLYKQANELLYKLIMAGVPFDLTEQQTGYIVQELPVLPLVFANRAEEQPHIVEDEFTNDNTSLEEYGLEEDEEFLEEYDLEEDEEFFDEYDFEEDEEFLENNEEQNKKQKGQKKLPIYEYFNGDQFKFNKQLDDGFMILVVKNNIIKEVTINTLLGTPAYARKIDNIQYVMEAEKLCKEDAISVLIGIYDRSYELSEDLKQIVERYREALISDEFRDFLDVGRAKAEERGIVTHFYDIIDAFRNRVVDEKSRTVNGPSLKKE